MERRRLQSSINRHKHVSICFRSKNSVFLTMDKLIEQIRFGNNIQNNINILINTYLNSTNPNNHFPLGEPYRSYYFTKIVETLKVVVQEARKNENIFDEIKWLETMKRIGYRGEVDENNTNILEKLGCLYKYLGDKEYSKAKPTDKNWPKIQPIVIGYYEKATNNGNNDAKTILSSLYETLADMKYNEIENSQFDFQRRSAQQKALEYFKKAYELGNPNVFNIIGLLYEQIGDECKNDSAIPYYEDAIKFGNSNVGEKLANIYNMKGYQILEKNRLVQDNKMVQEQMNKLTSHYNDEGHKVYTQANRLPIREAGIWFEKSMRYYNNAEALNNYIVLQREQKKILDESLLNNLSETNKMLGNPTVDRNLQKLQKSWTKRK